MQIQFGLSLLIFGLAGCTSMTHLTAPQAQPIPFAELSERVGGVWQSDGYGYVLDLNRGARLYHASGGACLRDESAGADSPLYYFGSARLSDDGTQMDMGGDTDPYDIRFVRIPAVPEECGSEEGAGSPLRVFDQFAAIFAEHYGFFDAHDVDWASLTATTRAGLGADSSEMAIVEAIIGMISRLEDGHVSLSATVDGDEGQFIAYPGATLAAVQSQFQGEGSPMAAFGQQYLREDIEQLTLNGEGRNTSNERMKYGITSGDIGYLAIMSVGGFATGSDASPEEERAALQAGLDDALTHFADNGVKAVLIDLSVNQGGYDFLGRQIAGRFAAQRTLAFSKYAADAADQTPQPLYIEPSDRPSFRGPVYVLTSDVTVSAAETLTLSLRALPNVTHLGATTRGALSDVLTKPLLNGWEVTLSNEVYLDHTGVSWEGRGIPPHHAWQVFDPANPFSGHFPAVEQAIALIDREVSE